jgi:hypothetical protein
LRPEAYSFVEDPIPVENVTSADGVMLRTAVLRLAMPIAKTQQLTLRATGLADIVGNKNDEAVSEPFWVQGSVLETEDTTLRLLGAEPQAGGARVLLRFNEKLTAQTAQAPMNYFVSGGKRVARVEFTPAKAAEVVLVLDGSTPLTQGSFVVTARNLMLAELPDMLQHAVTAQVLVP